MPPSHKSGSIASGKSTQKVPRRPKSPVSMYQMDFGASAPRPPPRPLIPPKPTKSRTSTPADKHPVHTPSRTFSHSSLSSSVSSRSFVSSNSSKDTSSSLTLSRLFSRKRKTSTPIPPSTKFEPPDTPTPFSIHSSAKADILRPLALPIVTLTSDENGILRSILDEEEITDDTNDGEIVEVLRDTSNHTTSQTHDNMTTVPPRAEIQRDTPSRNNPHAPSRPSRNPKRPKTAPQASSRSFFRPLPAVPSKEAPAAIPHNSQNDKYGQFLEPQIHLDTKGNESSPSSLTRSNSISHSMMVIAPRPDSPFLDYHAPMHTYFAAALGGKPSLSYADECEKRQGWSGEWNIDDIQDVIQKLRELK